MSTSVNTSLTALDNSGALSRSVFEHAPIGIAIVRLDGTLATVNPAWCVLCARSAEELMGMQISALTHTDDKDKDNASMEALLQGEIDSYVSEKHLLRKDGESIWVQITCTLMRNPAGLPEHLIETIEDIHLRKLTALVTESMATTATGKYLFEKVAQTLAQLLGLEFAMINDLGKENSAVLTPLALWAQSSFLSCTPGPLPGTACAAAIGEISFMFDESRNDAPLIISQGARTRFPDDARLAEHEIEGYAGIALWGAINVPLGTLAVMSRQPIKNPDAVASLLSFMAARVTAELRQMRENQKFQDMFDSAPNAILLLDSRGTIHFSNSASEALLGWQARELPGQEFSNIFPDTSFPALVASCNSIEADASAAGTVPGEVAQRIGLELLALRRDESRFPAELFLVPLDTGSGAMMVAYLTDIRMRKRLEQLQQQTTKELEEKVLERTREINIAHKILAKKEVEVRAVLENIADGVIGFDADGNILSANRSTSAILGYSIDQMIGLHISELISALPRDFLPLVESEVRALHSSGELIDCEWVVGEYHVNEQRFFTGTLRDVRERKRLMQTLKTACEAAEQASLAKSNFLATMSHEIRTPMNGVVGMVELLEHSGLKDEQIDMIKTMRSSAFNLLNIIDDVLDFSKIEAGELGVETVPFSIASIVEGVCDTLDAVAQKAGVTLTLLTSPALPQTVLGDPTRLRQVLLNLAGNAIKFSNRDQEGRVMVRAELAPVDTAESTVIVNEIASAPTLLLSVTDNGIGIAPEAQAKLFQPFSQADESTTRRFGGTGLGLSISLRLVQLMGGRIDLYSEPGKGACFTVRLALPTVAGEDAAAQRRREATGLQPNVDLTGIECLLVGELQGLASGLAAYLTHGGATVSQVQGKRAAGEWMIGRGITRGVVVVDAADAPRDELPAPSAGAGTHVRFVVVGRGLRRQPRCVGERRVSIDSNSMHRTSFLQAVALAAGRAPTIADGGAGAAAGTSIAPSAVVDANAHRIAWQGTRILVAEDNELNQKVLVKQLALLGIAADVSSDGRAAFERWRLGSYPLLLTDLHMPEMDGYELARAIRASEVGDQRMPIVALTANALKGEMQHCLSLGMDDYFTKPLQLPNLEAMLKKWLPTNGGAGTPIAQRTSSVAPSAAPVAAPVTRAPPAPPKAADSSAKTHSTNAKPVDVNVLKSMIGDDPADIQEFLNDFRISAGTIAADMQAAYRDGQFARVGELAHKLKSSARSVGALALGELCADLELSGKQADLATLTAQMPPFEQEIAAVINFLQSTDA